jgi:hypothetical protein
MVKLNKNKTGVVIGCLLASVHFIWVLAILVAPKFMQQFLDWIFGLHMLEPVYTLTVFSLLNAAILLVIAFVAGYLYGWLFAAFANWIHKK